MYPLKDRLPDDLSQAFNQSLGLMEARQLQAGSWQLEDVRLNQLRHKLSHDQSGKLYPILKEVYGSPYRGVLTGLNDAFVIDRTTRNLIIAQDSKSAELIKPFLEGKDLKKWHAQPRELYLIFTRRGTDIEAYPGIKEHLEQYKERLMPKPKDWPKDKEWSGRKSGPYKWFEIQDTVGYFKEFEKPKIQYAHFSSENLFHKNTQGSFSNDKSYIVPTDDWALLGYLNSKAYWFMIKAMAPAVRGGFYECRAQYMETLPIPAGTEEQKVLIRELAEHCQALAEKMYAIKRGFASRLIDDLCPADKDPKLNQKSQAWYVLDFKTLQVELKKSFKLKSKEVLIPVSERNDWQAYFEQEKAKYQALTLQLNASEIQLNQAVYQLFDLTEEEISIIELEVK